MEGGNNLKGAVGELHMTIQITRAATGKTEEYKLVGFLDEEQRDALVREGVIQPTEVQEHKQ